MAYELSFTTVDEKGKEDYLAISQKILAIEAELVKLSEVRANTEAEWRKKENFLQTELGKLQILQRSVCTATLSEV